jgi:antitoxin component YwqK of YwqJK toxin-antitoxin module
VLEEETAWRDGSAHGTFAAFWPSGARRTEGRYCGGAQCGRWRSFDAGGKQVGEVDYGEQRLVP